MAIREDLDITQLTRPGEAYPAVRQELTACWIAVTNAGGAAGLGSHMRTDVRSGEATPCGRVRDNSASSTATWAAATAARVGRRLAARPVRT